MKRRFVLVMKNILTPLFDFFLPRICPGCNKKLSNDTRPVCDDCLSSILIADEEKLEHEFEKNFKPPLWSKCICDWIMILMSSGFKFNSFNLSFIKSLFFTNQSLDSNT